jgi:hypothetical protein
MKNMNQEKTKSEPTKADDEQNFLEEEKETPEQKFKRIATEKCETISKNIIWLLSAPKQPMYEVSSSDAKKIISFFESYLVLIQQRYTPIQNGMKISKIQKISIQNNLFNELAESNKTKQE